MGWTYIHREPGESVKDLLKKEFVGEVLDIAIVRFRTAYIAHKWEDGRVTGIVCLLDYVPTDYFNFGFKSMGEEMGPYSYDCPKRILDLLTDPPENEWAREWREKCRQNLGKGKKIKPGDIVRFPEPLEFTDGGRYDIFLAVRHGKRKVRFRPLFFHSFINAYITSWGSLCNIHGLQKKDYEVLRGEQKTVENEHGKWEVWVFDKSA